MTHLLTGLIVCWPRCTTRCAGTTATPRSGFVWVEVRTTNTGTIVGSALAMRREVRP